MLNHSPPMVRRGYAAGILFCCLGLLLCIAGPARAQSSANDGYAPDGSYRLNVELSPYLWLPATNTGVTLGPRGGISGNISTGVPSISQLVDTLHGAFLGFGLVRYGPWSGELNVQWVTAGAGKAVIGPRGTQVQTHTDASLFRISPGFGYEVARGSIGGIPATLDARAGFSWFHWSSTINTAGFPQGLSGDGSFVQPWLGVRARLFPAPRWRLELDAAGQGFGVGGGSWGWVTSLMVSYAVTDWIALTAGASAVKTSRIEDNTNPRGTGRRTFDILAYGPVFGVTFRF